mgnify:FL=1
MAVDFIKELTYQEGLVATIKVVTELSGEEHEFLAPNCLHFIKKEEVEKFLEEHISFLVFHGSDDFYEMLIDMAIDHVMYKLYN